MFTLNEMDVHYITDKQGQKTAVILDINEFEDLLEDIEDLAAVADRHSRGVA